MTPANGNTSTRTEKKVAKLEQRVEELTQTVVANGNGALNEVVVGHTAPQAFPQHPPYLNGAHCPSVSQTHHVSATPTQSSRKRPLSTFQADAYPYGSPYNSQPIGAYYASPQPNSDTLAQGAKFAQHSINRPSTYQQGAVRSRPGLAHVYERYMPNGAEASAAFHHFLKAMVPHMPIIAFPENVKPDFIRATKPTLFLAILSVATSGSVQTQLTTELLRILGERIMVRNEASLELMQALQIMTLWSWPTSGKTASHDQYCSMACTMAIMMGMATPTSDSQRWSRWTAKNQEISIEGVRAYLGCFLLDNM